MTGAPAKQRCTNRHWDEQGEYSLENRQREKIIIQIPTRHEADFSETCT